MKALSFAKLENHLVFRGRALLKLVENVRVLFGYYLILVVAFLFEDTLWPPERTVPAGGDVVGIHEDGASAPGAVVVRGLKLHRPYGKIRDLSLSIRWWQIYSPPRGLRRVTRVRESDARDSERLERRDVE